MQTHIQQQQQKKQVILQQQQQYKCVNFNNEYDNVDDGVEFLCGKQQRQLQTTTTTQQKERG